MVKIQSAALLSCFNQVGVMSLCITTMCLEFIEDNPYLIAMCAVGTASVAEGSWIEKPPGLKPDYVVEGSKRMNIFERNAYIEKYYPNN